MVSSPKDFTSYNKVLKLEFTQSLAAVEYKYQTERSRKSERHGLDIFTVVAGLFREPFEEGWLMWHQCSFCYARARGCLPLGTLSVCVCVCVHVFQERCTEPQPGAIPDYPRVWHTYKHTPRHTRVHPAAPDMNEWLLWPILFWVHKFSRCLFWNLLGIMWLNAFIHVVNTHLWMTDP